jgi:hypothetical protein
MEGKIRAEIGQYIVIQYVLILYVFVEDMGQGKHVVEDQTIGHQVVVLYQLPLFLPVVLRNGPLTAEEQPLGKPVERLAFVGGCLDGAP